ncbi:hypothetical protein BIW11_10599 [Tropilaelaps mercedesae]|uniref:Uncharacterized protein n=1 Tax=Tropilaelaps mercedesae TaxID=418985 RepID=A0A1V9XF78_9ACAR|nr:hypothetical protein BIW11_10599 [Tropilaelaps mercedesae]
MHLDSGELQIFPGASFYKCYVEDLLRHGDNDFRFGNSRSVSAGRHRLEPADNVQAIRVFCRNIIGLTIYSHIHLVPPRVSLTPAVVIEKPHTKQDEVSQQRTQNVFIFGVDSVSRLAALRLLPFTYKYLVENMSAVVLRSHHKVGDNTFPNIITILSGDRRVHPADTPDMKQDYFDDWPLIWKRFSKEGYETLYAEDFPQFSTFNYLANGFSRPPTHHYLRPFWLAIEYSMLSKTSSLLCYGAKPKYQLQLDYIKYFLRKKRTNPYFAFSFLVEISHEYQEYVGAADRDFVEVLKLLKGEVLSGRTLLIVLSDHGHRFDSIRRTRQGHIEERLPFVAIATANTKHKAMLRLNSNMLTSHYDLHEVLRSLLPARSRPEVSKFGIDILQNVVPRNRTCAQAGVTEVHCTCVDPSNSQGEIDGTNIKALGTKAVKFVNEMLRQDDISRSVCKTLSLRNIRSSFSVGQKKVLTLITSPGGAIFELRIDHWNESLSEAMFSRINRYGTPCVPSQILRKYCYCG